MKGRTFENQHCQFLAYTMAEYEGQIVPVGFKAVTARRHQSLGLNGNTFNKTPADQRTLTYELGSWIEIPQKRLVATKVEWGGLACARIPSEGDDIRLYYEETRGAEAVVLAVLMKMPIFASSQRIKCQGVYPFGVLEVTSSPKKNRERIAALAGNSGIKMF